MFSEALEVALGRKITKQVVSTALDGKRIAFSAAAFRE
jgi:hypothetical protein